MKPKNFPSRRQQRRVEALERLKAELNNPFPKYPAPYGNEYKKRLEREIKRLETIIAKPLQLRTKKDRSSRASLRAF